jgi:hypothetical protein
VRDFEVYGNDLIVATHGRGFWVVDDISPLRQVTDVVLAQDAYLFKPSDSVNVRQGGDNGTPYQKDEPQAENPVDGATIDFYLKSAASDFTLEISDAAGTVVQTYRVPTEVPAPPGAGNRPAGIPNTSPLWRRAAEPMSTTAGVHRVVWVPRAGGGAGRGGGGGGGGGFGRGGGQLLTGTFTAKLTVAGKSYTQSFNVKPDPRG